MKAPRSKPAFPGRPLMLTDPDGMQLEAKKIQHHIACRAYELFEERGREHGYDWEDWFRAESELLRPAAIAMMESGERLSLRVNVLGFNETELKVSIEPLRLCIVGRKQMTQAETEGGKKIYIDWYPDLILRVIPLAMEIVPEKASMELRGGVLKFELPKASRQSSEPGAKAA